MAYLSSLTLITSPGPVRWLPDLRARGCAATHREAIQRDLLVRIDLWFRDPLRGTYPACWPTRDLGERRLCPTRDVARVRRFGFSSADADEVVAFVSEMYVDTRLRFVADQPVAWFIAQIAKANDIAGDRIRRTVD